MKAEIKEKYRLWCKCATEDPDLQKELAAMDENQMVALVYRELRRIGPEGEILTPDVHDWWQILMGLGRKWFYPESSCPNLLDDNVDWKKLMGTYYEEARAEREA